MKTVVERMASHVGAVIRAVGRQFLVGQCLRTGDELAGVGADEAALPQPVLHRGDGAPVPDVDGLAEHPAVVEHVAVEIADAFPRDHRGQMGRAEGRRPATG